jgi:hypothetical protein
MSEFVYPLGILSQGLLDDQFTQLQLLQDENNPEFVSEVVSLFFDDSEKLLEQLTESLYEFFALFYCSSEILSHEMCLCRACWPQTFYV